MAVPAIASATAIPIPVPEHPSVLLAIPDANLLQHGQYRLQGRFQYFTSTQPGAADTAFGDTANPDAAKQAQNMYYNSELAFGIENRAEVGALRMAGEFGGGTDADEVGILEGNP